MNQLHLTLFFTRNVSLRTWEQVGMLEREVAIYQRLQERGVQVTFVTYGDASDLRYTDRIPGIRILCNRWGLSPRRYERWLPVLHGWHLWRADIYKTNQTKGAHVTLRAARLFHKPLIARCGYMWSRFAAREQGADSEAARHARTQEAQVFTAADRVVVTAEHMKQYIAEQYGLANGKVTVIPNYVLTDLFKPNPNGACKLGRICFVGRLDAQKNLFALLEAIRGLDVELEIIGNGSQREALEAAARDKWVNVRFLGNRPHAKLPQHFNAAAIFILPSLYEGHPKTLLEAMSCGRPVIGTDVPGIRELIKHREIGYLCDTSAEGIRAAIQEVLSDADLRAHMGRNAREFVIEHFALERVMEMELALLKELAMDPEITDKSAVKAPATSGVTLRRVAYPIVRRMRRLAKRILMRGLECLPTLQLESLIYQLVARRVVALSADKALRFLFRLDAALYPLQGQKAIEYDGGIHTKHRHIRYHDFFVGRIRPGERVLDIGCGHGAVAYDVAEKASAHVVGIDLNPENIALARQRHAHPRIEYRVGDALQGLPDGPFDAVILSNVLEHLPERVTFLCRVQQEVARPSRFLIRVPLFERDWRVPLKRELGVEWRLDPTHETEYTLESFAEEMTAAGLRITHQEVRWGEIWAEAVPDVA